MVGACRSTIWCLLVLSMLVLGCGTAAIDVEGETPEPLAPPPTRAEVVRDEPPPVRGTDGELLESDVRVAGLVLPRGLDEVSHIGGTWVYRSSQPMPLVLRYFGTRLLTGNVERGVGGRATYRDAVPSGVDARAAIHLDVTISTSSGAATRVEITEIPPVPETPPTLEEINARIEAHIAEGG
jgi:hypothetical protein